MKPNEHEVNGRFATLEGQRNDALNEVVLANGRVAALSQRVRELEAELSKAVPPIGGKKT